MLAVLHRAMSYPNCRPPDRKFCVLSWREGGDAKPVQDTPMADLSSSKEISGLCLDHFFADHAADQKKVVEDVGGQQKASFKPVNPAPASETITEKKQ